MHFWHYTINHLEKYKQTNGRTQSYTRTMELEPAMCNALINFSQKPFKLKKTYLFALLRAQLRFE